MKYAKRFGLWTSALACAALMACAGSDANRRAASPGDTGSTNAQPDTPAASPSPPVSQPPPSTAAPGTTRGPQPTGIVDTPTNGSVEYPAPR